MTAPRTDPQSTVPVEPPDDPLRVAQQALASLMAFAGFAIPSANRDEQWDKPDEEAASILGAMLDAGYITIPGDAARASQPITATREALVKTLASIRARGELMALSGEHVHWTDADVADLILTDLAALPVREDEPTGIDVERMAEALHATAQGDCGDATGDSVTYVGRHRRGDESWARMVCTEYDRLTREASHVR